MVKAAPKLSANHRNDACMLEAAVGPPADTSLRNSAKAKGLGFLASMSLVLQNRNHRLSAAARAPSLCPESLDAPVISAC